MQNLRSIRKAKGLSQAQLAEMAEVNQATISKIESGTANFTSEMVSKLAHALSVSEAELFGLPELQLRVLQAINRMDPSQREAALVVLEAMSRK
ncbi:helix-turn-helix domain-containing protein [Gemmobacter caeni]|uniref:Helix-turn-helix protein n=1 Tax=Gemmobacter caeni TaxID=589035 RepID=A0A2T6A057_9RHOB|nr:helix-turn-helix transcriptional regulator [Gemmobacter caeni]PTX36571.1 helix-turn-helix protein [Gemmobacter caeni]PTX37186.1 helix-turn-helix protein [Gemmobacter caeni]